MADFDLQGLFGGINTALMSPGALAGLGLLSGEGISGAAQGVQAGTQAIQARELQRQAAIKAQRDQDWQNQFANGQSPAWAKGLPASLLQTAVLAGPDQGTQLLGNAIVHKGDADAQIALADRMAKLDMANKIALARAQQRLAYENYQRFMGGGAPSAQPAPGAPPQAATASPIAPAPQQQPQQQPQPQGSWLDQLPAPMNPKNVFAGVSAGLIPADAGKFALEGDQQKLGMRAQIAKQAGMDPNDPVTREYVMTGSYPKQEKNWPAINKADSAVQEGLDSLDVVNDAGLQNQKAFGPGLLSPSTKAWLGSVTGIGKEGTDATQQYVSDMKVLSGQLAKAVGGTRPTAFEQKLLADSQGSLNQTPEVRANIIERFKTAIQRRLDLAQKQAEELRNGTYYRPGNTGTSANRTFNWHPNTGLTEVPQ